MDTDVIVVGAGLAGLAAAAEVADAGKRVLLLDQEPEQSLGGQAFWSLGGLFLVDSPEQRRMGIKDSRDLALQDWLGSAQFDREEDRWPRRWAEAYVDFAAGEKRAWLRSMGLRVFPVVGLGRARRRPRRRARQLGAALPPHLGDRPGRGRAVRAAGAASTPRRGRLRFAFRHRVDELVVEGGAVVGVRGKVLEPSAVERGQASSRVEVERLRAARAGGDRHQRRHRRQPRPGPQDLAGPARARRRSPWSPGVPAHVDGRMLGITEAAGARVINPDRMWHYVEGIRNWDPIWDEPRHPDPARPVVAVARRRPASGCRRRTSRASTPSAR